MTDLSTIDFTKLELSYWNSMTLKATLTQGWVHLRSVAHGSIATRDLVGTWKVTNQCPDSAFVQLDELKAICAQVDAFIEIELKRLSNEPVRLSNEPVRLSNGYEMQQFGADCRATIRKDGTRWATLTTSRGWQTHEMLAARTPEVLAAIDEADALMNPQELPWRDCERDEAQEYRYRYLIGDWRKWRKIFDDAMKQSGGVVPDDGRPCTLEEAQEWTIFHQGVQTQEWRPISGRIGSEREDAYRYRTRAPKVEAKIPTKLIQINSPIAHVEIETHSNHIPVYGYGGFRGVLQGKGPTTTAAFFGSIGDDGSDAPIVVAFPTRYGELSQIGRDDMVGKRLRVTVELIEP
jgi:hypothetical protein